MTLVRTLTNTESAVPVSSVPPAVTVPTRNTLHREDASNVRSSSFKPRVGFLLRFVQRSDSVGTDTNSPPDAGLKRLIFPPKVKRSANEPTGSCAGCREAQSSGSSADSESKCLNTGTAGFPVALAAEVLSEIIAH